MAIISSDGFSHVRITVTDIARSRDFYDRLFGWDVAIDESDKAGQPGMEDSPGDFYGGVVYQTPQGTLFGLRPVGKEPFQSDVTGLDHVSFSVSTRAELDSVASQLDEQGVTHGDVIELTDAGMAILSIQDPDNINIELAAPLG